MKFGPSNVLIMSIYIHYINSEAISKKLPGVQAPFRSHCASDFRNTAANVARQRQNVRRQFIKMADEKFELAIKRGLEGQPCLFPGNVEPERHSYYGNAKIQTFKIAIFSVLTVMLYIAPKYRAIYPAMTAERAKDNFARDRLQILGVSRARVS